jgi:hypothetical protein
MYCSCCVNGCYWNTLGSSEVITHRSIAVASALVWIFPNKAYTSKYYLWYCFGRIRLNGHFLLWNSTTVLIIYCTVIVCIMKYKIKEGMFSQTLNFVVIFLSVAEGWKIRLCMPQTCIHSIVAVDKWECILLVVVKCGKHVTEGKAGRNA